MVFVAHGTSKQKLVVILDRNYLHRGMFVWDASTLEADYPQGQAEFLSKQKVVDYAWRWAVFKYGPHNAAVLTFEVAPEHLVRGALSANEKILTKDLALDRDVQVTVHRTMPEDVFAEWGSPHEATARYIQTWPFRLRRPVRAYRRSR